MATIALLQKTDSIRVPVPDIESGLDFYRDELGQQLVWRTEHHAGLRLPGSDAFIVLVTRHTNLEFNFHVASAAAAAERFEASGGRILVPVFKTKNGEAAVVEDPFGNIYALRDDSEGELVTDEEGHIIGVDGAPLAGA